MTKMDDLIRTSAARFEQFNLVDAERAEEAFRSHISQPEFPCLGAKASLNGGDFQFAYYPEMGSASTTTKLAADLSSYALERAERETDFATFAASFAGPIVQTELEWEQMFWRQLQDLHAIDSETYDWDKTVSDDPNDPQFSFSVGGLAFFVVGMHPAASRMARRFAWPTIVFNVHAQFGRLREKGIFERMKEMIRTRDKKLQGDLNPNLSDFGTKSEARQYSGRAVEKEWQCPFHRLFRK